MIISPLLSRCSCYFHTQLLNYWSHFVHQIGFVGSSEKQHGWGTRLGGSRRSCPVSSLFWVFPSLKQPSIHTVPSFLLCCLIFKIHSTVPSFYFASNSATTIARDIVCVPLPIHQIQRSRLSWDFDAQPILVKKKSWRMVMPSILDNGVDLGGNTWCWSTTEFMIKNYCGTCHGTFTKRKRLILQSRICGDGPN